MQRGGALAPGCWRSASLLQLAGTATSCCRIRSPACYTGQPQQRRQYAVIIRKPRFRAASPLQPAEGTLMFTAEDVPPMSFWEAAVSGPDGLSARDFHKIATQYCAVAAKSSAHSAWKGMLQRDYGIDPYMLHYTSMVLLDSPPGPGSLWRLGTHMLKTASGLDYTPSTISFLRLVLMMRGGGPEDSKYRTHLRGSLDHLYRLVKAGEHPDALTVHALLRLRAGNYTRALKDLDAAIEAADRAGDAYAPVPAKQDTRTGSTGNDAASQQRTPKWAFESDCHVERGRILLRMGNHTAAAEAFRIAAFELDSSQAYMELGKMLPANSQLQRDCLLKSAVSGSDEACRLLSASETVKSREEGLDKVMLEEHLRWAAEWDLLGHRPTGDENVGEVPELAL